MTEACPDGCETQQTDGDEVWQYTGPACQQGNVGYMKPARQSGQRYSVNGDAFQAANGVDGVINDDSKYVHTGHRKPGAFWEVDLMDSYVVQQVIIYTSPTHKSRLSFKEVVLKNTSDGGWGVCNTTGRVDNQEMITVTCAKQTVAKFVRIQVPGNGTGVITFKEVKTMGYLYRECPNGRYGPGCVKSCDCGDTCHSITGQCPVQAQQGSTAARSTIPIFSLILWMLLAVRM